MSNLAPNVQLENLGLQARDISNDTKQRRKTITQRLSGYAQAKRDSR